jgi:hypothetical protein
VAGQHALDIWLHVAGWSRQAIENGISLSACFLPGVCSRALLVAVGRGGSTTSSVTSDLGTPVGIYTITITASSDAVAHSSTFTPAVS